MGKWQIFWFIACLGLCFQSHAVKDQEQKILGFKEWKGFQVQRAQETIKLVQQEVQRANQQRQVAQFQRVSARTLPNPALHPQVKLQRARFNLQVARELTIHDYFALYLSQIEKDPKTFKEIAKKLSPEEMAELLQAYSKSTQGSTIR